MAVSEYSIAKIDLIAFHLSRDVQKIDVSNTAMTYNVTVDNRVIDNLGEDIELLKSAITITIGHQEDVYLVVFEASVIFEIKGLSQVVKTSTDGKSIVPQEILDNVSNVSISMARGMLFSHLRGTKLHNAILPLVELNGDPTVRDIND